MMVFFLYIHFNDCSFYLLFQYYLKKKIFFFASLHLENYSTIFRCFYCYFYILIRFNFLLLWRERDRVSKNFITRGLALSRRNFDGCLVVVAFSVVKNSFGCMIIFEMWFCLLFTSFRYSYWNRTLRQPWGHQPWP